MLATRLNKLSSKLVKGFYSKKMSKQAGSPHHAKETLLDKKAKSANSPKTIIEVMQNYPKKERSEMLTILHHDALPPIDLINQKVQLKDLINTNQPLNRDFYAHMNLATQVMNETRHIAQFSKDQNFNLVTLELLKKHTTKRLYAGIVEATNDSHAFVIWDEKPLMEAHFYLSEQKQTTAIFCDWKMGVAGKFNENELMEKIINPIQHLDIDNTYIKVPAPINLYHTFELKNAVVIDPVERYVKDRLFFMESNSYLKGMVANLEDHVKELDDAIQRVGNLRS